MGMRTFAIGMRQPLRNLTNEEILIIKKEIKRIKANESVFIIDIEKPRKTSYDETSDRIYVGSNVFPDLEHPTNMTDKLTVACVLAHEYYGHRVMREEYLNEEKDTSMTPLDEFNASYLAFQNTPNLTYEERSMLLYHAYEIAREGYLKEECEKCEKMICDFCFNNNETKENTTKTISKNNDYSY